MDIAQVADSAGIERSGGDSAKGEGHGRKAEDRADVWKWRSSGCIGQDGIQISSGQSSSGEEDMLTTTRQQFQVDSDTCCTTQKLLTQTGQCTKFWKLEVARLPNSGEEYVLHTLHLISALALALSYTIRPTLPRDYHTALHVNARPHNHPKQSLLQTRESLETRPIRHPPPHALVLQDKYHRQALCRGQPEGLHVPTLADLGTQSAYLQSGYGNNAYQYNGTDMSPTNTNNIAPPSNNGTPNSVGSQKRKNAPNASGSKPVKKVKRVGPRSDVKQEVATGDGDKNGDAAAKPKRVRTGCLTCRERHLKCDEGLPNCNNCNKSNKQCKRGVRLNFIDTWTERPSTLLTLWGTKDWKVEFQDESRGIASEYVGGTQRYKHLDQDLQSAQPLDSAVAFEFSQSAAAVVSMAQSLPPIERMVSTTYPEQIQQPHISTMTQAYEGHAKMVANHFQDQAPPPSGSTQHSHMSNDVGMAAAHGSVASYNGFDASMLEPDERKEYLDSQEETFFLQVFVEEVGLWMDSMDSQKHFSRLLPFHSLSEPMLLNAFLACGARHLTLINPVYSEEKALHYYDTATRHLLKNLQNPNRDTVVCATTAVILNVYEIMSERALQRMNHIAGARALIKECGWNARAQGIGSACFWLNVGLEVLSCLHFNWQVAWDPDDWHLDMDLQREPQNGREEVWTHRMLYIIAKICNFRATMPRQQDPDARQQQLSMQQRHEQWSHLKSMCDSWNDGIPRTMHPMAYLYSHQTSSKSLFPEVWLIKRSTIVARLFYHTAMLLMAQIHPYWGLDNPEMFDMQKRHSQMICGIVAHVKDRGVASVAIRSLHHAAECLTDRKEQEEVLTIFDKINKETGWRIGFVYKELKEKWKWDENPSPEEFAQTHTAARQAHEEQQQRQQQRQMQEAAQRAQSMTLQQGFDFTQQMGSQQPTPAQQMTMTPPQPPQRQQSQAQPAKSRIPSGIPNPMYAKADFNLPQHPYQNFYVAPSQNINNGFGHQSGSLYFST